MVVSSVERSEEESLVFVLHNADISMHQECTQSAHVSFIYSKAMNVTFTSFANLELDTGGRLYSEFQLTM